MSYFSGVLRSLVPAQCHLKYSIALDCFGVKHVRLRGFVALEMVQNFIEFVLLKSDIEKKFSVVEKRVSSLFDVQLKRSKEEDSLRCWVKLEGNQYDIARAKVR